jgi:hypothetical protein
MRGDSGTSGSLKGGGNEGRPDRSWGKPFQLAAGAPSTHFFNFGPFFAITSSVKSQA